MPSPVYSVGSKVVGAVTNFKPVKWTVNQFKNNFDDALIYTTIGSIVVKDGVGCATYVKQSLNNKEIPEKRRNFVAALDLTNGVLMIVSQIMLFLAMHKLNKPLFEKLFSKTFGKEAKKSIITQTRIIQKAEGDANDLNNVSRKIVIHEDFDKLKKSSLKIFEFVTDLVASAIIAKRVVVPLIATPLASRVEAKMNAKHPDMNEPKDAKTQKETQSPSMQGSTKTATVQDTTNLLDKYKN
ncbi:MAG: hypothetical protein ACI37Q_07665 [Candidatus Gastranaerophilaceae bacterium]